MTKTKKIIGKYIKERTRFGKYVYPKGKIVWKETKKIPYIIGAKKAKKYYETYRKQSEKFKLSPMEGMFGNSYNGSEFGDFFGTKKSKKRKNRFDI